MGDRRVDLGVSASAFLVIHLAGIADIGDDQPMLYPAYRTFVQCQPGNRANRSWNKDESVGIPKPAVLQGPCQEGVEGDPGEIIVTNRRMADVTGDEHLIRTLSGDEALCICQASRFKRRVDNHIIQALLEIIELILAEAESPALLIVRCLVRDPVGAIG